MRARLEGRIEGAVWFARDLLAAVGVAAVFAYFGHPNAGNGFAFLIVLLAIGARIPGDVFTG